MALILIDDKDLAPFIEKSLVERLRFHEQRNLGAVTYSDDLGARRMAALIALDLKHDAFPKRYVADRSTEGVLR